MMHVESPRVVYESGAQFVRTCSQCGRFVKPDGHILVNDLYGLKPGPNATCKRCGRVEMPFEGFVCE